MGRGGVGTFRFLFYWRAAEPSRGARDWSEYDALIANAARNHIRTMPQVWGTPAFLGNAPNSPPTSNSARTAFAAFLKDAVDRYGSRGAFWAAHPALPKLPPAGWEVWNEPSVSTFWAPPRDPKGYVRLLKVGAGVIRKEDPKAKVVVAGIPNVYGALAIPFLKSLYKVHGFSKAFDVMNVHPYAVNTTALVDAMKSFRSLMAKKGDGKKPIWITEVGWASNGPSNQPQVKGRKGQANTLRSAYKAMLAARKKQRIGLMVWFAWRDRDVASGEDDWWGPHTGLFTVDGHSKPAWNAYVKVTGGRSGSGQLAPYPSTNPNGSTSGGSNPSSGGVIPPLTPPF